MTDPKPPIMGESLPAPLVNRFYVASAGGLVRITFGEMAMGGSNTEHARAAITMTASDAAELGELLKRVAVEGAKAAEQNRKTAN